MRIIVKKNKLSFLGATYECAIGKNGTTQNKIEGDGKTPIGCFSFKKIFYRDDKTPPLKFGLDSEAIMSNSGWCDDPESKNYNQFVKLPVNESAEKLFRSDDLYDLIFVLDYNINPIVKNKGSAIFLHIAKNDFSATEGCIALKKNDLIGIAEKINDQTQILIVN